MKILKQSLNFLSTITISLTDGKYVTNRFLQIYHNRTYPPNKIAEFAMFGFLVLKRTIFEGNVLQILGF